MNRRVILYSFLFTFIFYVKCENTKGTNSEKSKKFPIPTLPYFRRKVEELGDADFFETTESDDPHNLVEFLVKNMKEIFNDILDTPEEKENTITLKTRPQILLLSNTSTTPTPSASRNSLSTVITRPILGFFNVEDIMSSSIVPTSTRTNDLMLNENLTLPTLLDANQTSVNNEVNTRQEFMKLAKDLNYYTKDKKERDSSSHGNTTDVDLELSDPGRSCIMCNNVATEECNDPRNKLITSIMCERDDDLCYSLHTPFGIVDRGCFNINHNLTTYVCSCNLCNYLSISEMPFMFAKKKSWVENIIELSRTKHFRKSVFKDMSCLKCEVNTTTKTGDMLDSANCLEGNIGNLPVEDCNIDEVCAIKALRADGYIWRGCVKAPLYNYWWSVCDRDLCNYDTLVTLFEFLI